MPSVEPLPIQSKKRSRIIRYNLNDLHCDTCRLTIGERRELLSLMLAIRKPENRKRTFLPDIKCRCWECTVATIRWTNTFHYYQWVKFTLPWRNRMIAFERIEPLQKRKETMPQIEELPVRKPRSNEDSATKVEWLPSIETIVEYAKANHNDGKKMITLVRNVDWKTDRLTVVPRAGSKSTTKVGVGVFRKLKPILEKEGFAVTERTSAMTDDKACFSLEPLKVSAETVVEVPNAEPVTEPVTETETTGKKN